MSGTVRSISKALYAVAILGIAIAAAAQSPLDQDWHQWSSDVCLKILTASPWVTAAQPEDPKNVRRAVLLSSLLVRQAMLRQLQIRKKYDTIAPEKRKEFDEQTADCLNDPKYTKYIVLRVWNLPHATPSDAANPTHLGVSDRIEFHPFINDAALTCGGDSFPWQYVPTAIDKFNDDWNRLHPDPHTPHDAWQFSKLPTYDFLYSRSVNGKPLIQAGDRTMVLNCWGKGGQFTFQLADLVYKDKLDF